MQKDANFQIAIAITVTILIMITFFLPQTSSLVRSIGLHFQEPIPHQTITANFFSDEYGFGFTYPAEEEGYTILTTPKQAVGTTTPDLTLVLVPTIISQTLAAQQEGNISIQVFKNVPWDLTAWAEKNPNIGYQDRVNEAQFGRIEGRDALWFQKQAKKGQDVLLIKNGSTVMAFIAEYQNLNTIVQTDFINILESIHFTKPTPKSEENNKKAI